MKVLESDCSVSTVVAREHVCAGDRVVVPTGISEAAGMRGGLGIHPQHGNIYVINFILYHKTLIYILCVFFFF